MDRLTRSAGALPELGQIIILPALESPSPVWRAAGFASFGALQDAVLPDVVEPASASRSLKAFAARFAAESFPAIPGLQVPSISKES